MKSDGLRSLSLVGSSRDLARDMQMPTVRPRLPYANRSAAGQFLAERIIEALPRQHPVVLGLPRGGLPVAFEVSARIDAPLDVLAVRKLGVPGHEELAMGAIAAGGARVINPDVVMTFRITAAAIDEVSAQEQHELERREHEYRHGRAPALIAGCQVIIVDDGLATGATVRAAALAVSAHAPAEVVVAVPVGPRDVCAELSAVVDRVICPAMPEPFFAVGVWYRDFRETTDDEVTTLLDRAYRGRASASGANGTRG